MECLEPSSIKFDFLGKDSVPYENTVEVKPQVFRNVRRWIKKDAAGSSAPSDPDPNTNCAAPLQAPVHRQGSMFQGLDLCLKLPRCLKPVMRISVLAVCCAA